jgi:hypothetical protein
MVAVVAASSNGLVCLSRDRIRIRSRRLMRSLIIGVGMLLSASYSWADAIDLPQHLFSSDQARDPWHIDWISIGDQAAPIVPTRWFVSAPGLPLQQQDSQPLHAAAVEHSDAYQIRAKIHKYSSFATLPLFAVEIALGQSLYNTTPGTTAGANRGAHALVGAGIVGLFGLNTVTGAWNLFGEGWSDKQGRTLRLVHGLLMMAADVGFLATTASAPNSGKRGALTFDTSRVTHRDLAYVSISVATTSYLLMLLGNR